jgi:cholesterol transport system auxiliary component
MSLKSGVRDDFSAVVSRLARAVQQSSLSPLLVVVALAGCAALTRQSPVRETFLLDPPAPPALAQSQPGTLRVGTINVAAPFRGKSFVYRVGELRFETDYYVEFLVTPAAMIAEQTARALDHAKVFARVAGPGTSAEASWVLDAFVSALYVDRRDAGKPVAELDIEYFLTSAAESAQTPVWHHEYRQRVAMRDASAAAYADALNKAFGDVLADLARDLAGAPLPKR